MKYFITFLCLIIIVKTMKCQNIVVTDDGGYQGDFSAMLDIKSSCKGLLIPRITLSSFTDNNSIQSPANGLLVYNSGTNLCKGFYYWNENRWIKFFSGNKLSDDDGDTKILLESSPGSNEDYISFYTGIKGIHNEVLRISKNRLEFKHTGNSVFVGDSSGSNDNLNNNLNTYIGNLTGKTGEWNINCVYIGFKSGYYSNYSYFNTFIGTLSGVNNQNGSANTFVGNESGYHNTYGKENVFFGAYSGYHNTTGNWNVFIGKETGMFNTTGTQNIFIGSYSGFKNSVGYYNTFVGDQTGYFNTNGYENTFMGSWSGKNNVQGSLNVFMGANSGFSSISGNKNVFIGNNSGYSNNSGSCNVLIGESAGMNCISGNNNIFIGYHAGYNETASNKLYIDNSSTANPLIFGDFVKDSVAVNGQLNITAAVSLPVKTLNTCSYSISSSDYSIFCNSASPVNLNLPNSASAKGRVYVIKKLSDTGINPVTIHPYNNEKIDGESNKTITVKNECLIIQSDGFNWFIIAKY